jgi:hypothetical protein
MLFLATVFGFSSCPVFPQSTSPWMKIAAPSIGLAAAPSPGEGYMTVSVKAASAYQNSNWWTSFVERNRQAVLTASLSATIANVPVSQTVTGNAIALNRNNSMVDLGFSGTVVDHLPTTFSGMVLTIQINKTAQDGLQNLISQVNQLSTAQPPVLAISAQTMQITSLAKNVADFLFNARLLVTKAQTRNPFPIAGALDPEIYVCFAGDQQTDYQQYLADPSKLSWNGAVLTFQGQPVNSVSYFIVEVDYQTSYFAKPLDSLNFGASKPWVTLYLTAQNEIPGINSCAQAATAQNEIQSHLSDARTLLTQDYGFTNDERDAISNAVYTKLNEALKARLTAIDPAACNQPLVAGPSVPLGPGAVPGPAVAAGNTVAPGVANPIRPNILVPDLASEASHEKMVQSLGIGRTMTPSAPH